jgi:NADH-quinone oxidoreductase subunit J
VETLHNRDLWLALAVVVLGSAGTYLLLPHRHGSSKPKRVHITGAGLVALSLLLFISFFQSPGPFLTSLFFYVFSLAALAGGVLTITSRNPIHSALWFASVVLSTSGLFLIAGAQFLAAGTVIVYAGAIIVTFLFVIMLAQMEGRATYDRAARSPFRATMTCFVLFWGLLYAIFLIKPRPEDAGELPVNWKTDARFDSRLISAEDFTRKLDSTKRAADFVGDSSKLPDKPQTVKVAPQEYVRPDWLRSGEILSVYYRSSRSTARLTELGSPTLYARPKPHVAGLGETLYTDYLIASELSGALLFVALVGALTIATPKRPVRPAGGSSAA